MLGEGAERLSKPRFLTSTRLRGSISSLITVEMIEVVMEMCENI